MEGLSECIYSEVSIQISTGDRKKLIGPETNGWKPGNIVHAGSALTFVLQAPWLCLALVQEQVADY